VPGLLVIFSEKSPLMTADSDQDECFGGRSVPSSKPVPQSKIEISCEPCLKVVVSKYDREKDEHLVDALRFLAMFTPLPKQIRENRTAHGVTLTSALA